jgi:outer membrane protein OmpA-like peptidoglycan-associated protein
MSSTRRTSKGWTWNSGGSSVNNLADALLTFGLAQGAANLFAATYETFGDLVVDQYPELVPSYPPVREILDTSYLQAVARKMAPKATPATTVASAARTRTTFKKRTQPLRTVVSRRSWKITFQPGSANFSPESRRDLERLRRDLLVASGTAIEVHGHTDGQGDADKNMELSEARAFAVKRWLETKFPVNFPANRVQVYAHGEQNPVAPNTTEPGRAQNRRVEVVLGTG